MAAKLSFIGCLVIFPVLFSLGSTGSLASAPQIVPAVEWLSEPTPTPNEQLPYPAEGESLPLWILLCAFGGLLLLGSVSWPIIVARLRSGQSRDRQQDFRS